MAEEEARLAELRELRETQLTELLDTITRRLRDSMKDMEAAVRCIETYKTDPKGAQTCILNYLKTGTTEKLKGE